MALKQAQHIAIVMDGNRRWAKRAHLSYLEGYTKAVESIQSVLQSAINGNIPYLTLFAFSTENSRRSEIEIQIIKRILSDYISKYSQDLIDQNIRLRVIGDYSIFGRSLTDKINTLEQVTASNHKLNLTIALNYSGQTDILRAINQINAKGSHKVITKELLAEHLYTHDLPDPDILIRTGGHKRISNFMLWQLSYTELFFLDVLWPDFSPMHLDNVLKEFQTIERKYGR